MRCVTITEQNTRCRHKAVWGDYCSNHSREFVVLVGQAGSGKSTTVYNFLQKELKLKCKLDDCSTVHFASVDPLVEADRGYQTRVKAKKSEYPKGADLTTMAKALNDIYLDVRDSGNYSRINELLLLKSVLERRHVVFEITGLNYDTWKKICDEELQLQDGRLGLQKNGYRVTVVLVYTSFEKLQQRLTDRLKQNGRLTPVDQLEANENKLIDVLSKRLTDSNHCIDRLVVYDNNGRRKLILDQGFRPAYKNIAARVSAKAAAFLNRLKF